MNVDHQWLLRITAPTVAPFSLHEVATAIMTVLAFFVVVGA